MRRKRGSRTKRCRCGRPVRRLWFFCPGCGRELVWGDDREITGAECESCGWVISGRFSCCAWCGADVAGARSSDRPLRSPRGFRYDAPCDAGCGGGVQYPMQFCPWCGAGQTWPYSERFEGACPHCDRGVNDAMDYCVWCGNDATGRDLIQPALRRVRRLLRRARIPHWGYRLLLRPGVSGVDPRYPTIVEIDRRYAWSERTDWPTIVGLIAHELGHSFLFTHWSFARSRRFRRAFGNVDKAYRGVDASWAAFGKRGISKRPANHVTSYAATHPLEDFAETFRFYVLRRGRVKHVLAEIGRKRKATVVYEKFLVLHSYLGELRARHPGAAGPRSLPHTTGPDR